MYRNQKEKIIVEVFGDLKGFQTKGLNDETEILDCIIDSVIYFNENFKALINTDDLPDKEDFLKISEDIANKRGLPFIERSTNSFTQVYLTRLYSNLKKKGITLDGITSMQDVTVSASYFNGDDRITIETADRENYYKNYKNLSKYQQQKFKQELRKKVITHELAHASGLKVGKYKTLSTLMNSFEEILAERIALGAEGIKRKIEHREIGDHGGILTRRIPNIESSNGRIFAVGEILSKIVGEERMQSARLLGKEAFVKVLTQDLNISEAALVEISMVCDAAADKDETKKVMVKLGKWHDNLSLNHNRILAQLYLENEMINLYKEKMITVLEKPLTYESLDKHYNDLTDIRNCILKFTDSEKKENMPIMQTLSEIESKIQENALLSGISQSAINETKRESIERVLSENDHPINVVLPPLELEQ